METTNKRECTKDEFSEDNCKLTLIIEEYFKDIKNFLDINIGKTQRELSSTIYETLKEDFVLNVLEINKEEVEIKITRENNKQGLLIKINKNE